ncbi:MAG: ATP-grasp domain-containing protein [Thermodesulfobacteriota bacterium]
MNAMTWMDRLGESYLLVRRRYVSTISGRRTFRILFSKKDDWEPAIRKDFRYTRHELTFDDITAENVKRHDLIVPIAIEDILFLDGIRELVRNNPIPIPSAESVRLCDDKYRFNKAMIESRFAVLIPKMGRSLLYPYILKKRSDGFGANSHIITCREQEDALREKVESEEYFCQEIVRGDREYTTHMLIREGRTVCHINLEFAYDRDMYIKGPDKPVAISRTECPYLDLFGSILRHIGFEGLCCFNYKVAGGRPMLIEINPRFGASLSAHFFSFVRRLS